MKYLILSITMALLCSTSLTYAHMPDEEEWASQIEQWQGRMKTMHEQMNEIAKTQDPQERQRLLAEHWQTMAEQMDQMNMMGNRMMGPGMMDQGMGIMHPGMMRQGMGMMHPGMMGQGMCMMQPGMMGGCMMRPGMMGGCMMRPAMMGDPYGSQMYGMMHEMMQHHLMEMHGGKSGNAGSGMHKGMHQQE